MRGRATEIKVDYKFISLSSNKGVRNGFAPPRRLPGGALPARALLRPRHVHAPPSSLPGASFHLRTVRLSLASGQFFRERFPLGDGVRVGVSVEEGGEHRPRRRRGGIVGVLGGFAEHAHGVDLPPAALGPRERDRADAVQEDVRLEGFIVGREGAADALGACLLYTSPSPRD